VPVVLTEAEELFLGWPVEAPRGAACDARGCNEAATLLIPRAALCEAHAALWGIRREGAVYEVPVDALTGGVTWRDGREGAYLERLEELRVAFPVERTPEVEATLDALVRRHAARLGD
jgi:hypothetical protein